MTTDQHQQPASDPPTWQLVGVDDTGAILPIEGSFNWPTGAADYIDYSEYHDRCALSDIREKYGARRIVEFRLIPSAPLSCDPPAKQPASDPA
jgi:hypothetical protein